MIAEVTEQLSPVVGAITVIAAVQTPASAVWVWSAEQLIVGTSLSVTVISCVQVFVFPDPSVTVRLLW